MNEKAVRLLLALVRSAISGNPLRANEKELYSDEILPSLLKLSAEQDLSHLVSFALKNNALAEKYDLKSEIIRVVYRYEGLNRDAQKAFEELQKQQIPFIALKGAVIRSLYPEEWMRTSCDTDILIHKEDLERAVSHFTENMGFTITERSTHDVALTTKLGNHIELHYDLLEENRANNAGEILSCVWDNATLKENSSCQYVMSDEFFYFYHIAHTAKHFENGGCGIKPLIDLWLLDNVTNAQNEKRDTLLEKGRLLKFATAVRRLVAVWFEGETADSLTERLEGYILSGGLYGTADNRVAIAQEKQGGRLGYMLSRVFVPYSRLKRYYPVLEKHKWLTPFMQVRRWFMLFKPDVAKMAKGELSANKTLKKSTAKQMKELLSELGL